MSVDIAPVGGIAALFAVTGALQAGLISEGQAAALLQPFFGWFAHLEGLAAPPIYQLRTMGRLIRLVASRRVTPAEVRRLIDLPRPKRLN
jgi:hypothetical protein